MTAEIICVGTELLLGDILNTNAQFLSRELAELGISVMHQHVIGDNPARLKELVLQAKSRSDLLVFSGGLGPTEDDLTKETVAEAFGDTLAFDEGEWQKIIDFFARTNRRPTPNNRKQAMCPTVGHKLINDHGTAPGAWFVTADYESGEIKLQAEELNAGAFYTKDNLPEIPGKLSLARKLIDDWLGENSQTDLG